MGTSMGNQVWLRDVTFQYPGAVAPTLRGVSLELQDGDCIAVMGANGCGKTTLSNVIAGIIPNLVKGTFHGETSFGSGSLPPHGGNGIMRDGKVAFLFQNPEDQFLTFSVRDEFALAASLRSTRSGRGVACCEEYLKTFGCEHLLDRSPSEMSMGELQRIAILAAAFQEPEVLIFDEPTTALDRAGLVLASRVLMDMQRTTRIVNTHDLGFAKRTCSRVLGLRAGIGAFDWPSDTVREEDFRSLFSEFDMRDQLAAVLELIELVAVNDAKRPADVTLSVRSLRCEVGPERRTLFDNATFEVPAGRIGCIVGSNGSGKTTLLMLLAGLLRLRSGNIAWGEMPVTRAVRSGQYRFGVMLQNPSYQLIGDSIEKEMFLSLKRVSCNPDYIARALAIVRRILRIDDLGLSPRALSYGWQKLLTFIGCLCLNPSVFLLDEPELGLDVPHKGLVTEVLRALRARGRTIVIVCHEAKMVRELADCGVELGGGRLAYHASGSGLEQAVNGCGETVSP